MQRQAFSFSLFMYQLPFTPTKNSMRLVILLSLITTAGSLHAQQNDSSSHSYISSPATIADRTKDDDNRRGKDFRLTMKAIVVPASLITYGVISQSDGELREFDVRIRNMVRRDADFHTPVDNYLQYIPGLSVYALNAVGIKGKNNFLDRTMIYLLSNAMMSVTVQSIKKITASPRPDGFGKNAFPSGHTATAFAGAEFLRQEYKDVSPWYGIAGYAIAATTGILRMYNNRHWFRDVVAGAGIGIISTDFAYWLEPVIAKKLSRKKTTPSASPYGN